MLAWRPDGGALAALGQDTGGSAHLSLFDASTGRFLLELPGAGDVGHGITFTPDGGLLFGLFGSNPAADGQKPGLVVAWDGAGAVHARWDALSAGDWWSVTSGPGGLVMGSGTGFAQRFVPTP